MENHRRLLLTAMAIVTREFLDTYESSDSDEDFLGHIAQYFVPRKRRKVPRLLNYVENIVPAYNNNDFKVHFRIQRTTFEYVLSIIAPSLQRTKVGTPMISPEKQFLITLWRMATPDAYRSICEKFNVSRSTALYAVRRVTLTLVRLATAIISWPVEERVGTTWRGFEEISAFPKIIGAIDGKHICIPAPQHYPESYVNRKGHHSIQLQAICDHKARFTHVFVGHVGSVHDQRIFRQSEVQDYLGDPEKFPQDCHLVGDSTYKLHDNLLVPFRDNGHLTQRQKNFNFCLSSARIAIERAFGLLTARFRSLLNVLAMSNLTEIPNFILACCVLHNLCSFQGDMLDFVIPEVNGDDPPAVNDDRGAYAAKRYLICERLQIRHV